MRIARTLEEAQEAMGMDWANWHETKEAIPPAYAEFIGRQFLSRSGKNRNRVSDSVSAND